MELVDELLRDMPLGRRITVHDLACGTGSMARWLAPYLPGPQHWVQYDHDAELLARAAAAPPTSSRGVAVSVDTRERDITRLDPAELAGASLITASALIDLLTDEELQSVVAVSVDAACPVLWTLSVLGRVELLPTEPVDAALQQAFNAHQRRDVGGRRLLGPDAVCRAAELFRAAGHQVQLRTSGWELGAADAALAIEWFLDWFEAACDRQPDLCSQSYRSRRLAQLASGRLSVTVHHVDLLARPR